MIKFIEKYNNIFDIKQTYYQNISNVNFNETNSVLYMLVIILKKHSQIFLKKWLGKKNQNDL